MVEIKNISVKGMKCVGCETILEDALNQHEGVEHVDATYANSQIKIGFDKSKTDLNTIYALIDAAGYEVDLSAQKRGGKVLKIILSLLALLGIVVVMIVSRKVWHQFSLPEIGSHLSEGMIFTVGLITGLHCIGMCGGFVINYTSNDVARGSSVYQSHLLYGAGKTLSYAMFGAFFGFLGSLVSITPFIRGISAIFAGLFLIIFGLNMLNIFAPLKRIRIKQPEAMAKYALEKRKQSKSPFFIGFFSGFILGCGPLQAMYVLAAGNSDPLQGAKMLALFGLGTLPALLGFGFVARFLSGKMTRQFLHASGVILIFIGSMMLNKGLIKTKSGYDFNTIGQKITLQVDRMKQGL